MDMPKDFYDMVCADIERLSNTQNLSGDERLKLHREMDGKYQACIKNGMRDYAVQTKKRQLSGISHLECHQTVYKKIWK